MRFHLEEGIKRVKIIICNAFLREISSMMRLCRVVAVLIALLGASSAEPGVLQPGEGVDEPISYLPPPDDSSGEIQKLELGQKLSLDDLGPMVLNKDGTISRITNWDVKLPHEKEIIMKKISRRNAERAKILNEKLGESISTEAEL